MAMNEEVKFRIAVLRWAHFHEDCTDANDTCPAYDECFRFNSVLCDLRTAADLIESLSAQLEKVTRERDAAVNMLKEHAACDDCKRFGEVKCPEKDSFFDCIFCSNEECICNNCENGDRWQWRGAEVKE